MLDYKWTVGLHQMSVFPTSLYVNFQSSPGGTGNQLVGSGCHHNILHRDSSRWIIRIMEEESCFTVGQRGAHARWQRHWIVCRLLHYDRYLFNCF